VPTLAIEVITAAAGLTNGGFETPSLAGGYQYAPPGATWVFSGGAGISGNGTAFTSGNPPAPEGVQVAFLQGSGQVAQTADQLIVIGQGRLLAQTTVAELSARSNSLEEAFFQLTEASTEYSSDYHLRSVS